jgi:hypothetical protein
MSLNPVPAARIKEVWPFVVEGLNRIHQRSRDRWCNEDIYMQLKLGNCGLYIVNDMDGFVILQPLQGWDGGEMMVFVAYIPPGGNVMEEAFEDVKRIARESGMRRLKFQSMRNGWGKKAAILGWKPTYQEYEMEI